MQMSLSLEECELWQLLYQSGNIFCSNQAANNMSASNPAGTKTQLQLLHKHTMQKLHALHARQPEMSANTLTICVISVVSS